MSDVAVIGAGYVGSDDRRLPRPPRPPGHVRRHRRRAGRRASRRARSRSSRTGLPELVDEGLAVPAARASSSARRERGGDRRVRVPLRADARRATTARPTSRSSRTSPARSRRSCAADAVVINKSTMPVGSTRLVAADPRRGGRATEQVGVASNPEFLREGTSVRDFLQPEPRRDRLRRPRGRGAGQRALPVAQRADARHRPRVGRDDQVRVERVPRHQDLVHERDREPVRDGRRRRARGRARHGLRPAHRLRVPAPRARATAARASRRTPRRCSTRRGRCGYDFSLLEGVRRGQPPPARAHGREGPRPRRRLARRACRSRSGASRSRPTPTTCGTRPRS